MELSLSRIGARVVVAFPRRVDLEDESAEAFKTCLKALVRDGDRHVVMDLGNVGFVDSLGLGVLISALKVLRSEGGSLVLANVSEPVEAVLRITRLVRVFDVHPTVVDALSVSPEEAAAHPAAG